MPSVDIVIPCYNHGSFLPDSVGSVLSKKIDDLRILIVDNASTDGSADVARQLASGDARIELLSRNTNQGPHASFNAGIDWARGTISSFYARMTSSHPVVSQGPYRRSNSTGKRVSPSAGSLSGKPARRVRYSPRPTIRHPAQ
jgi:hypothetical protein